MPTFDQKLRFFSRKKQPINSFNSKKYAEGKDTKEFGGIKTKLRHVKHI